MSLQKRPSFFLNFSEPDLGGENGHSYHFGSFTLSLAKQRLPNKAFEILDAMHKHRSIMTTYGGIATLMGSLRDDTRYDVRPL
jgi:hypothetical protein